MDGIVHISFVFIYKKNVKLLIIIICSMPVAYSSDEKINLELLIFILEYVIF